MFLEGARTLATLTPNASGTAIFSTTTLAPGATRSRRSTPAIQLNASVTSAPLLQTVDAAITSTGLTSNANPSLHRRLAHSERRRRGQRCAAHRLGHLLGRGEPARNRRTEQRLRQPYPRHTQSRHPPAHRRLLGRHGRPRQRLPCTDAADRRTHQRPSPHPPTPRSSQTASPSPSPSPTATTTPPTGTVSLTDNGASIPPATLDCSGRATVTLTAPALGAHTLIASYAGDAQNVPAASQPFVQTVVLRPTTTTFNTSSTNLSAGQQLILISVVQPGSAAPRPPTGQVTFQSGTTVLGTTAISAAGVATLTVTAAQANLNTTAIYSGDSLYAPSTSPAIIIVVGPPIEFTLSTPGILTLQSGQHGSLQINVATAPTFVDTLAFGCAGLPASATCTFSQNQVPSPTARRKPSP